MVAKGVLFLLSFILAYVSSERIRYDGYRIYQVVPDRKEHLELLSKLEVSSDSLIYLTPVSILGRSVNILVAPHKQPEFRDILENNAIPFELAEENLQQTIDAEEAELAKRSSGYDWTGYHTLDETYEWLRHLEQTYPQYVQTVVAGTSYEGRHILGVKVSFKSGNKGIFMEGGIHSREWISPATVTYVLNEILTTKDTVLRTLVQKFDWYIFPHVNPDGYVYTHTTNRLWRKTRSPGTNCYGTDANRNFDFKWMSIGASDKECSETYAGKLPFSEIETKTLSEYVMSLKGKLYTYLGFHSYSQLILLAYGYTPDEIPNYDHHMQMGQAASRALSRRFGTQYKVGSSYTTIYPTSGSSRDWAYGVMNIPIVFSYELRPTGGVNGFVLPSAQIIPTAQETLDSLVALITEAEKLGYYDD